jgi:RNA polymerase sigma-70 factor (ECF subfamily)
LIWPFALCFAAAISSSTAAPGSDAPAFGRWARFFGRRNAPSSPDSEGEPPDNGANNCLERLRLGDSGAARQLVEEFEKPLIRYFRVALPDPSLAEDAAQEVFARLVGSLREGKAKRRIRSAKAVVFTIARRLALDVRKSAEARYQKVSLDDEPEDAPPLTRALASTAPDPRRLASASEETGLVADALNELDPEIREIIVLRLVEGLSAKEVAGVLGVAEGTVWSRQNRGLATLREKLAPKLGDAKGKTK